MAGLRTSAKITAPISYVASVPADEKAYHMMFDGDTGGLPRTNIERSWVDTDLENLRGRESALSFDATGIAIQTLKSQMTYTDFDDESKVWKVYFKELETLLSQFLEAKEVLFFRYGVRKRHRDFPISTGEDYAFPQPTSIAHVDATLMSTEEEMRRRYGDRAETLMKRRFQWVNVWKPLRGPVNDWPLCFCDASSVDPADAEPTDMVYPDYFTENLSFRPNRTQKWFYLSDQRADEIIIFKQSDSSPSAVGGVPHCSFANPESDPNEPPRESIEARALVIY